MCIYNFITEQNIEELVETSWISVKDKVENGHPLSSEKTLVFMFALEITKRINNENFIIDFENRCYDDLGGESKYLDLLFYTDVSYKVAIEFKLPKKSNRGNSNHTQTRKSVYRDLARLKYLKDADNNFKAGYFLMAIDEDSYLNNRNIRNNLDYITRQNHNIQPNNNLTVNNLSLSGISCEFNWMLIEEVTPGRFRHTGRFAWLSKIRV